MKLTRRKFSRAVLTALSAPALIGAKTRTTRLPIAFSTLGCPKWEWKTILSQAATHGYSGIELRGIQGELDLTKRPEFNAAQIKTSLNDLASLELRITDLGASTRLHEFEPAKRAAAIDEGKRFIDLAYQLKAPYIRVFGDKVLPGQTRAATIERVIAGMRVLGEHAKSSGVVVIIESHGDFADSASLKEILKASEMPTTGLLWDAHHTFVLGKEQPATTFRNLGRYVRHTHLKDSRPSDNGVQYVLTGAGTVPVRDTVKVLVANRYRGYYCFEWEKMWHPELEEPEIAFPHYAKVMREYLTEAGIRA